MQRCGEYALYRQVLVLEFIITCKTLQMLCYCMALKGFCLVCRAVTSWQPQRYNNAAAAVVRQPYKPIDNMVFICMSKIFPIFAADLKTRNFIL